MGDGAGGAVGEYGEREEYVQRGAGRSGTSGKQEKQAWKEQPGRWEHGCGWGDKNMYSAVQGGQGLLGNRKSKHGRGSQGNGSMDAAGATLRSLNAATQFHKKRGLGSECARL